MERAKQPQRKPTKDSRGSAPGSHLGPAPAQPLNALSSGDILQLQRTIGNKAVQRLLQAQRKDQGSTPQQQGTAPLVQPGPALSNDFVQRRIGFEFEGQYWRPYMHDAVAVPAIDRPARRQEALHQGAGFQLQGDDTNGADKPNIEFVTDPFEISKQGLSDLKQALSEIRSIMKRISKHVYQGSVANQIAANALLTTAEHGLSDPNARLAGGAQSEMFKMQTTQGISLEDLPRLMEYFGTNVPGETKKQRKERKGARMLAYGNETGNSISDMLGGIPSLAQTAVTHIANNRATYGYSPADQTHFAGSQQRLVGFFAQVLMIVKGLTIPDGKYMKYKIPFLQRIHMNTVFGELSARQQAVLSANNSQALIDAVIAAANAQSFLRKPAHVGGFWDTNFAANAPLLRTATKRVDDPTAPGGRRTVPLMTSLTLGAWLNGIATGHDYLDPAQMDAWLQNNEGGLNAGERQERTDLLESFNTRGTNMDAPDRPGTSRLNVLENRFIAPKPKPNRDGKVTLEEMSKMALQYFNYMFHMKMKGGNPGKF